MFHKRRGGEQLAAPNRWRKIKIAVMAVLAGVLIPLMPATAAQAGDNGNGNNTCDTGEICFRYGDVSGFNTTGAWMHTFWWSSWVHDQYALCDETGWERCMLLADHAQGVWNRDTECDVTLWDEDAYGNWYSYANLWRGYWGNASANRNNGHTRC